MSLGFGQHQTPVTRALNAKQLHPERETQPQARDSSKPSSEEEEEEEGGRAFGLESLLKKRRRNKMDNADSTEFKENISFAFGVFFHVFCSRTY